MLLPRKDAPRVGVAESNPYQRSFLLFLEHCAWTVDEARAGEVRRWPMHVGEDGKEWRGYWEVWDTALHECSPLFVDKTRRTMASNVMTAWEVWLCAGGQDPRWAELMLSDSRRLCLIQSKKLEGETGSMAFLAKAKAMVQQAWDNGIGRRWPDFPLRPEDFSATRMHCPRNGSRMEAIPQGADQVRGPGTTHLRMEEACFMDQVEDAIGTAIPALAGGGHLTVVTTPDAQAVFLKSIRDGRMKGR